MTGSDLCPPDAEIGAGSFVAGGHEWAAGPPAPPYGEADRAAVYRVIGERRDVRSGFRPDPVEDAVPGETESLAPYGDMPGVLVVRSLTKTWGLAGLRIGYVLAAPDLVAAMAAVQPPWSVSTPALAAAEACSAPLAVSEAESMAIAGAAHRAYLVSRLRELDGVDVAGIPQAPFVLLQVRNGRKVRQRLRERGYAVRRGDSFPGLGPTWMRVAVRDPATTDGFLDAFHTVALEGIVS